MIASHLFGMLDLGFHLSSCRACNREATAFPECIDKGKHVSDSSEPVMDTFWMCLYTTKLHCLSAGRDGG